MATYYVRPGGSDANAGTGSGTGQAWLTIQKALGATSGVVGGDTIYVAPGHYFEQVVIGFTSPSSTVQIIGDVTASQFSGVTAGIVRLSGFSNAGNAAIVYTGAILKGTSKNNLSFSNFIFEGRGTGSAGTGLGLVTFLTSQNIAFSKCLFSQQGYDGTAQKGAVLQISAPSTLPINATISKCVFESARLMLGLTGSNVADSSSVKDCIFFGGNYQLYVESCQVTVINNTFSGCYGNSCDFLSGSASFPSVFRNNLFLWCAVGISCASTHGTEDYNRFIGTQSARASIGTGSNSSTVGSSRLTYGFLRILGLAATDFWSPEQNSPNQGFGTATGAEATDVYSTAWIGATPDAGYQTYSVSSTLTPTYQPTERNASAITIAPASTSQSIELYLGATGLTFSTSGLAAYYVRNQAAPVAITLVTQTPTGAWASGGFAEISSSLVPGVYRLDVPNAAFAANASDVTIVVRGASGTNGAVLTVTLSSGGLTAAQTAAAVLDAVGSSYVTAGSIGYSIQNSNVASISSSTAAADELEGALLHNGTDYISAELLTPVSAATSVHIGPYQLLADGLGASDPLDVNVGTATSIDVQVTDANGTGIDITGATVTAKVYSSAGTLVASYAGTATYADNGRLTFGLTTTVTATSGTYTVTVTRTTGATDTQIFGPLRLYVRPV
jgi:hypothetical protein